MENEENGSHVDKKASQGQWEGLISVILVSSVLELSLSLILLDT